MTINELFETTTQSTTGRGLAGTAELTHLASNIADGIIKAMEADIETYRPRIQKSVESSKELDDIINELGELNPDDAQFLMELDDATIDGILKSQQSKRSRSKSKAMTLDNYRTMVTAAVAENIVRLVTGREKTHNSPHRKAGTVDYTGAQLEALAEDQNALRKEIRNIQSKKSIMKSKADFSENDERWLSLLKAEQQLKDLRIGTASTQVIEVDTTKNALFDMLSEMPAEELTKLKADDARELLGKIYSMVTE